MYQEWFEEYEKIINKDINYCPMCGRKLGEEEKQ